MKRSGRLSNILMVSALAVVVATALANPADAADRGRGRGHDEIVRHDEWRDHEIHARRWHHVHPIYEPGVVYAPPAVVVAPPPPPPWAGINLILPINIR